jgi:hypothetical protein
MQPDFTTYHIQRVQDAAEPEGVAVSNAVKFASPRNGESK